MCSTRPTSNTNALIMDTERNLSNFDKVAGMPEEPDSTEPRRSPFGEYHGRELSHQIEIARLEEEIKERKIKMAQEIESSYNSFKAKLENTVEKLQQECEEVEARFWSEKVKMERNNVDFTSRLDAVLNHERNLAEEEYEKNDAVISVIEKEQGVLQGQLACLSAKIAKLTADEDLQRQSNASLEETAFISKRQLENAFYDVTQIVADKKERLDILDVGLKGDICEKDNQFNYAIQCLNKELKGKAKELEGSEFAYVQQLEDVNRAFREAKINDERQRAEIPLWLENTRNEIRALKEHLEGPDTREDALKEKIVSETRKKVEQSEQNLLLRSNSLLKIKSNHQKKIFSQKSIIDSLTNKTLELRNALDEKMTQLKTNMDGTILEIKDAIKGEIKERNSFLSALQVQFQDRQASASAALEDLDDRMVKNSGKFRDNLKGLNEEIHRAQGQIDDIKAKLSAEEDEHSNHVEDHKIDQEKTLANLARQLALKVKIHEDTEWELKYLNEVEQANDDIFSKQIRERQQRVEKFTEEIERLIGQTALHKEASHRAMDAVNRTTMENKESSTVDNEKIMTAIKLIKKEFEDERDQFHYKILALEDDIRREKSLFDIEKSRIYNILRREQDRNQHVIRFLQGRIGKRRDDLQTADDHDNSSSRGDDKVKAESDNSLQIHKIDTTHNVEALTTRAEQLAEKIKYTEAKIEMIPRTTRPSQVPIDERVLKNKLYTLKMIAESGGGLQGELKLKTKCLDIATRNKKLAVEINFLSEQRLEDPKERNIQ